MAESIEYLREANRRLTEGLRQVTEMTFNVPSRSAGERLKEVRSLAYATLDAEIDNHPRHAWKTQLMILSEGETAHLFRFARARAKGRPLKKIGS